MNFQKFGRQFSCTQKRFALSKLTCIRAWLKVKDSIIEALEEENIKLQKHVKTLKLGYLI